MIASSVTYWPFGYPLKTENPQAYRFGFQGQEHDDEWTGQSGSHLAFKYRIHDARIGRFLSIDPLTMKYPHNSPYAFSENRVIDGVELEGLEFLDYSALQFYPCNGLAQLGFNNRNLQSFYPHFNTALLMQSIYTGPWTDANATMISIHRTFYHEVVIMSEQMYSTKKFYHRNDGQMVLKKSYEPVKDSKKPVGVQRFSYRSSGQGVSAAADLLIEAIKWRLDKINSSAIREQREFYNKDVSAAMKTDMMMTMAILSDNVPEEFINEHDLSILSNLILSKEYGNRSGISPDHRALAKFIFDNQDEFLGDDYPEIENNPLKYKSGDWKPGYSSWDKIWIEYRDENYEEY